MVSPIILSFCFKQNTKALMCFSLFYTSQEEGIGGLFGNALKKKTGYIVKVVFLPTPPPPCIILVPMLIIKVISGLG
jgi:hypothetical protein